MKPRRILVLLCLCLLASCATSPTGRKQLILVSPQQMTQLGLDSFRQMREAGKFADAPRQKAYASCVANALIAVLPQPWAGEDWQVAVIDDDAANAFALPGGRIGVNLGMFEMADSPDMLAAVLGHELAHVVARHSAERVSDNLAVQTGAQIAGAYGVSKGIDPQLLGAALGIGAQVGILLPFSRTQESEADVLGQRYMAAAGFDPHAAVSLWQKMNKESRSRPPAFLSTHPAPESRARTLAKQARKLEAVRQSARQAGRVPTCRP